METVKSLLARCRDALLMKIEALETSSYNLSKKEYEFLIKYAVFYRWPFVSREISSMLSLLYLLNLISAAIFLLKGNFLFLAVAIVSIPFFAYFSSKYNPNHFIAQKKDHSLQGILERLDTEKVSNFLINDWPKILEKHSKGKTEKKNSK